MSADCVADVALVELDSGLGLQFFAGHLQAAIVDLSIDLHELLDGVVAAMGGWRGGFRCGRGGRVARRQCLASAGGTRNGDGITAAADGRLAAALRLAVAAEDAGGTTIGAALQHGEWLKLVDHFLMVFDHLLGELFDFGILGTLERDLAQLDFTFVLCEQAGGEEMLDGVVADGGLGGTVVGSILIDSADRAVHSGGGPAFRLKCGRSVRLSRGGRIESGLIQLCCLLRLGMGEQQAHDSGCGDA